MIGSVTLEAAQLVDIINWINSLMISIREAHVILKQNASTPKSITQTQFNTISRAMSDSNIGWTLSVPVPDLIRKILDGIDMRTVDSDIPLFNNGQPLEIRELNSLIIVGVYRTRETAIIDFRLAAQATLEQMFGVQDPARGTKESNDQTKVMLARAIWHTMSTEEENDQLQYYNNDLLLF
ncbi:uncharacterized protein H6S33_003210 [Morchella sextelata]|uniref:uncharacterized protein n=1 Tax=Morchella sextelata TaxID=1174677 RepID=UPI001D048494|nr:uncharacterized protein H6S33_003210 [Morchella sextelata]KAH0607222.1 hypothetical protein H6S33_003210 [Morchella sextelata]